MLLGVLLFLLPVASATDPGHTYSVMYSGACNDAPPAATATTRSLVSSLTECSAAAASLGLPDASASMDNQASGVAYDPPGCYLEEGELKFNTGANTGPCTFLDQCICALRPATPPPAPPPPPSASLFPPAAPGGYVISRG